MDITVLIPTSPIPSHPETRIIEETVESVRAHLDSDILIMIDGVRDEQAKFKQNYQEYVRRLLWKCSNQWDNVYPVLFSQHQHQARMARKTLYLVRTSCILYVEHDAPLTPDREIPFAKLTQYITSGKANVIRLHHEALVLDVHKHLMIGQPEDDLWATYQWSQRPHLASTEFYKEMLEAYFNPDARTMIEDRIYGKLEEACRTQYKVGWNKFKVWLYYPGGDIKRSYHTDGREGENKYESTFGLDS